MTDTFLDVDNWAMKKERARLDLDDHAVLCPRCGAVVLVGILKQHQGRKRCKIVYDQLRACRAGYEKWPFWYWIAATAGIARMVKEEGRLDRKGRVTNSGRKVTWAPSWAFALLHTVPNWDDQPCLIPATTGCWQVRERCIKHENAECAHFAALVLAIGKRDVGFRDQLTTNHALGASLKGQIQYIETYLAELPPDAIPEVPLQKEGAVYT
jgi:hypothetical protein